MARPDSFGPIKSGVSSALKIADFSSLCWLSRACTPHERVGLTAQLMIIITE